MILFNGGTDAIQSNYSGQVTRRTLAFRCDANTAGGGLFGRIWFSDFPEYLLYRSSPAGLYYSRQWNGTEYQWLIGGTGSFNTPYSVVLKYDSSSASNNIVAWVNNAVASITNPAARSGTPNTTANNFIIGNNASSNRGWDGGISNFAVWSDFVPDEFCLAISGGCDPLIWRPNLVFYNPMIRTLQDLIGARTQTPTGTTVKVHPRVIRPYA